MSLNFPANPTNGDTYTSGSITYIYQDPPGKWTASTQVNLDTRYVNSSGDTMTGDLAVPSLNSGPLAGMRNVLVNGDFRIWQRGSGPFSTTTPSSSEYAADRWYVGTNNIAVSRNAVNTPFVESFDRAVQSTTSGNFSLAQMVELKSQGSNSQFYVGSTWTLSFWAKHDPGDVDIRVLGQFADDSPGANGVSVFDQTGGTGLVAGNNWQRLSFTFTVGATAALTNKGLAVYIRAATTGTFTLTGIQLESGPVATPFEHRPIGTELALCQRYYLSIGTVEQIASYRPPDRGPMFFFPVTMRAVPTMPVNASYWWKNLTSGGYTEYTAAGRGITRNTLGFVLTQDWSAAPIMLNVQGLYADAEL